ncbi:unnamed protein product, partial [Rotaria magnacalcarata]
GAFSKDMNDDQDEPDQQLLPPTMNGDCASK